MWRHTQRDVFPRKRLTHISSFCCLAFSGWQFIPTDSARIALPERGWIPFVPFLSPPPWLQRPRKRLFLLLLHLVVIVHTWTIVSRLSSKIALYEAVVTSTVALQSTKEGRPQHRRRHRNRNRDPCFCPGMSSVKRALRGRGLGRTPTQKI